jgi:hypothetical protein
MASIFVENWEAESQSSWTQKGGPLMGFWCSNTKNKNKNVGASRFVGGPIWGCDGMGGGMPQKSNSEKRLSASLKKRMSS